MVICLSSGFCLFVFLGALPPSHDFCKDPIAMILSPTRELCMQIEEHIKAFCKSLSNMKTVLLIGGVPMPQQLHRFVCFFLGGCVSIQHQPEICT